MGAMAGSVPRAARRTRRWVGVAVAAALAVTLVGCDYQVGTRSGELDPGFGADGRVRTDLGRAGLDQFTVVEARPGGDLFVAGDTGDGIIAGRYDGAGEPDTDRPPAPLLPSRLVDAHVVRDAVIADDGST